MNLAKKLYFSVFGTIDSVVDRLQNHDALVRASLAEIEEKLKAARTSLATLSRTLRKTEEDIQHARKGVDEWRSRAREKGLADQRDMALECLRRAQQAERTAEQLEVQRRSSESARRTVEQTIVEMQDMHKTLSLRHRELRVRQQCQDIGDISPIVTVKDAEEMLNRWQDSLGGSIETIEVDPFASSFELSEQEAVLEGELEKLLQDKA